MTTGRFVAEDMYKAGGIRLLAQRMLDMGYLLAPGALFHARRQPSTLMRINFATTQDARFWSDFAVARSGG